METLKGDALHTLQAKRLRKTVEQAEKVPFYQKMLKEAGGVRPEDIKTVDDVQKLPFTKKTDLQGGYPFGFFAVPMKESCGFIRHPGRPVNRPWWDTPGRTWITGPN